MSYRALLDDLETLQKSYAAEEDDKKIEAAAAIAKGDDKDDEEELDEHGKPVAKKAPVAKVEGDEEKDEKTFGKSFTGVDENGKEFEAVDGTELIKALSGKVEALASGVESEKADLTKSLTFLVSVIKTQGNLIKALQSSHIDLANQGRGRLSVMAPSQEFAKSLADGKPLDSAGFMLKANSAFDAGRITGKDLTVCDVAIRMGQAIDSALVAKVLA